MRPRLPAQRFLKVFHLNECLMSPSLPLCIWSHNISGITSFIRCTCSIVNERSWQGQHYRRPPSKAQWHPGKRTPVAYRLVGKNAASTPSPLSNFRSCSCTQRRSYSCMGTRHSLDLAGEDRCPNLVIGKHLPVVWDTHQNPHAERTANARYLRNCSRRHEQNSHNSIPALNQSARSTADLCSKYGNSC